ncbi:MAG: class I SAM-dependent methyltransferase [Flavobacteriales bacterium]
MGKDTPKVYADFPKNYSLLDAGGGQKLEKWGEVITIRPERQAYFKSGILFTDWEKQAHWKFIEKSGQKGVWKNLNPSAKNWQLEIEGLKLNLELTHFKHVGLFPEQNINWKFIQKNLHPKQRFLNLFAYTGSSSLVAKAKGAEVLHVDSVKQLVGWAKTNMETSELSDIKWVLEDALKFAQREAKRGNKYHMIQMDPPAWGLGTKGEKWKLEDKIQELIKTCYEILEPKGWLILNTYSPSLKLAQTRSIVKNIFRNDPETAAELWMKTETGKDMYFGDLVRVRK